MAGLAVSRYTGPPPLTVARAFESWTLDLPVFLGAALVAALYLTGVRRIRRAGGRWPATWSVAFLAGGIGTIVIATMSFLGVYGGVLFTVRAVQNVLILLLAPLLLALGRPLSLLIGGWPRLGRAAQAAVGSLPARVLTFPAVTALVLVITPFLLYFTSWYPATLHSGTVARLTWLALLAPGLLFFWTLLRVDPVPKEYPYLVSLWVTGAEVVGDAALGLAVIADQHLIAASYYQALARPWGLSLRADQVVGGGALWILGDLVGLPFLASVLIQMIREDEEEAVRVDAELDASEAQAAAESRAGGAGGAVAPDASPVPAARPWWENDARFTGRFHRPGDQ